MKFGKVQRLLYLLPLDHRLPEVLLHRKVLGPPEKKLWSIRLIALAKVMIHKEWCNIIQWQTALTHLLSVPSITSILTVSPIPPICSIQSVPSRRSRRAHHSHPVPPVPAIFSWLAVFAATGKRGRGGRRFRYAIKTTKLKKKVSVVG